MQQREANAASQGAKGEALPSDIGGYRVIELLGRGGMGEVFRVEREGPGGIKRRAALKRILPRYVNDREVRERFLAEARTNARLEHPNVVQVLDFGDQPEPYLVLEYVEGLTTADLLRELAQAHQKLPAAAAAFIIAEAAAGLDHAHTKRDENGRPLEIVHRDVSPQNILISHDGAVKVGDFGVARAADNTFRTQAGLHVGKLVYMAPEQAEGKTVDARADVFALGIAFWELLTISPLIPRNDPASALQALMKCEFTRPTQIEPRLPPTLDEIAMKALARDPAQRYPSGAAFAQALRGFLHSVAPGFDSGELKRIVKKLVPQSAIRGVTMLEMPAIDPASLPHGASASPFAAAVLAAPAVAMPAFAPPGGTRDFGLAAPAGAQVLEAMSPDAAKARAHAPTAAMPARSADSSQPSPAMSAAQAASRVRSADSSQPNPVMNAAAAARTSGSHGPANTSGPHAPAASWPKKAPDGATQPLPPDALTPQRAERPPVALFVGGAVVLALLGALAAWRVVASDRNTARTPPARGEATGTTNATPASPNGFPSALPSAPAPQLPAQLPQLPSQLPQLPSLTNPGTSPPTTPAPAQTPSPTDPTPAPTANPTAQQPTANPTPAQPAQPSQPRPTSSGTGLPSIPGMPSLPSLPIQIGSPSTPRPANTTPRPATGLTAEQRLQFGSAMDRISTDVRLCVNGTPGAGRIVVVDVRYNGGANRVEDARVRVAGAAADEGARRCVVVAVRENVHVEGVSGTQTYTHQYEF